MKSCSSSGMTGLWSVGMLALMLAASGPGNANEVQAKSQSSKPQAATAEASDLAGLTYDARRTREMYRLLDLLKATDDPKERRALQLQILPLAGGCVTDMTQALNRLDVKR